MMEPVAYLVEWHESGEDVRQRVQMDKAMEPWLRANEPVVAALVRLSDAEARIAELEAMLKDERERADRMANDWFTFCEDMEVTPDTQEAVAYELKADFSNLRARAEAAEALLKEAGEVLEPFAAVEVNELYDDGDEVSWPFFYAHQLRAARAIHHKIGVKDE